MSFTWSAEALDLAGVERLAARLALILKPGDCLTLEGELGAGKTTLARALIREIWQDLTEEIVSPTFALAETYETPRMTIAHFDCFRIEREEEAEELGLQAALDEALVLIEWPNQVAAALPADRLAIEIEETDQHERRTLRLEGLGAWAERLERFAGLLAFLERAGWGQALSSYLQGDASARRYARLKRDSEQALLMDSPRQADGPAIRDGKSYSALAHLAEDVRPFVAVGEALKAAGLSTPKVLASDLENGFLILEDFGDQVFGAAVAGGVDQATLYGAAVEVLLRLRKHPPDDELALPDGPAHALPAYDKTAFAIEIELLLDWFWPALKGEAAPAIVRAEFSEAWAPQIALLAAQRRGWVLRDFHSPNLIWLAERSGEARVGLIDYQDALRGPLAYDLVSLLQDARIDVASELEAQLRETYCQACENSDPAFDRDRFLAAYAAAGAQRNTKILGIFARLAARDGKRSYLAHLPRVSGYLERNLSHPALALLKSWYDRHLPADERASFEAS